MSSQPEPDPRADSDEITIRVRYAETDRMGLLHHANYFVYFEMGRTELLRRRGHSYRDIEDAGHLLVIIDLSCKFKRPAYYDD
ncbi:MAG TPA: thioesterase family protein, partial [Isosphaeraceae bacterium]|nr:thioesterase family protein [Isosphaeraceae bacterium]